MSDTLIRRARPEDADALAAFGRKTFLETFVDQFAMDYPADDLAEFLRGAYTPAVFARMLEDGRTGVWLGERGGEILAYAVAGPSHLPHPEVTDEDGELHRLYVAREAQGSGMGRRLLETALGWLERDGPRRLWIGVWSGNLKAQQLYARYGFVKAGEYEFPVGRVRDREFILVRAPEPAAAREGETARERTPLRPTGSP